MSTQAQRSNKTTLAAEQWLALTITLGAALIYAFRLGTPSLRGDEAFSAVFSRWSVAEIIQALRSTEPHPPLYYLFLHGWMAAMGRSEFMLRLPSMLAGLLGVPLIYALGQAVHRPRAGLFAAALAAMNPFLIWHGQDARMYSILAALGLASTLLAIRLMKAEKQPLGLWAGYVLVTLLAMATHYYALFAIAAQNAAWALTWLLRWWPRAHAKRWLLAQGTLGLFLLPWLLYASGFMMGHAKDWIPHIGLIEMARRLFTAFSLGTNTNWRSAIPWLAAYAILALIGAEASWRTAKKKPATIAMIWTVLGLPILATFGISLWRPLFDERYLIVSAPLYLLVVGLGWDRLYAWAQRPWLKLALVTLGAFLLAGSGYVLYQYHFDPHRTKSPDWRGAMAHIIAQQASGDLLILNYPDPTQEYYNAQRLLYRLLPSAYPVDASATKAALAELLEQHERLWLIPTRANNWDSEGLVEGYLYRRADLMSETTFRGLRVQRWHAPRRWQREMQPVEAQFGDAIRLLGYRLEPEETIAPGETVQVVLYWEGIKPMDVSYTGFVHLVDPSGVVRAQQDNPPVQGTWPTTSWTPGEPVVDRYEIPLALDAPTGRYAVRIGMYSWPSMERLPIRGSDGAIDDQLILTTLAVETDE